MSDSRAGRFGAVVLAGGRAARLGGADKPSLEVRGRTLLATALDAVSGADRVVVVGDPVPVDRPVTFVREHPRHGGPAAALLAGRDALALPKGSPTMLAVLACDMPHVTAATVHRLLGAAAGRDGAVLTGPEGRRQLAMVLDADRLDAVRPVTGVDGLALHRLLTPLELVAVPALGLEHRDVDTWADLGELES